jgi:chorismate mutase
LELAVVAREKEQREKEMRDEKREREITQDVQSPKSERGVLAVSLFFIPRQHERV